MPLLQAQSSEWQERSLEMQIDAAAGVWIIHEDHYIYSKQLHEFAAHVRSATQMGDCMAQNTMIRSLAARNNAWDEAPPHVSWFINPLTILIWGFPKMENPQHIDCL